MEVEPTGQGKRKLMKENQKLKDQIRELKSDPDKKKRIEKPAVKKMPVKLPKELWGLETHEARKKDLLWLQSGQVQQHV